MPLPELDHIAFLRHSFAVARRARAHGKHPFGAILVDAAGRVLMEQENAFDTEGRTGHAETVLSRRACAAFTAEELAQTTMYVSAEPCAMCAGSLYWAGIGRLVYAMSEHKLGQIIGPHPDNLTLDLPCRTVLQAGQREVEVLGPLLEDDPEAASMHEGAWER
ncbi:nucleoside deaminase [Sediminicoccus sp. KRV36]|uniref:nucleoside deaminase n=1 Tax=Sediminicoccus sp. KRV36 TaxID=3133721 RepID=UPI00200F8473|nr:nucleoside deaminase [Sediminicoccus rosea]UPY38125.1 nucleoside deaminase [Sediminicoccus rosea]